jgi:hypothetical protein
MHNGCGTPVSEMLFIRLIYPILRSLHNLTPKSWRQFHRNHLQMRYQSKIVPFFLRISVESIEIECVIDFSPSKFNRIVSAENSTDGFSLEITAIWIIFYVS